MRLLSLEPTRLSEPMICLQAFRSAVPPESLTKFTFSSPEKPEVVRQTSPAHFPTQLLEWGGPSSVALFIPHPPASSSSRTTPTYPLLHAMQNGVAPSSWSCSYRTLKLPAAAAHNVNMPLIYSMRWRTGWPHRSIALFISHPPPSSSMATCTNLHTLELRETQVRNISGLATHVLPSRFTDDKVDRSGSVSELGTCKDLGTVLQISYSRVSAIALPAREGMLYYIVGEQVWKDARLKSLNTSVVHWEDPHTRGPPHTKLR